MIFERLMYFMLIATLGVPLFFLLAYELSLTFAKIEPSYTEVLVISTDKYRIYARKSNDQWQKFSDHIKENLCYSDKPDVPFMILMPECHSISMTLEVNGVRTVGWSENIKLTEEFSTSVKSHLESRWDQISNKRSLKEVLA